MRRVVLSLKQHAEVEMLRQPPAGFPTSEQAPPCVRLCAGVGCIPVSSGAPLACPPYLAVGSKVPGQGLDVTSTGNSQANAPNHMHPPSSLPTPQAGAASSLCSLLAPARPGRPGASPFATR